MLNPITTGTSPKKNGFDSRPLIIAQAGFRAFTGFNAVFLCEINA